jgi:hypothetical protein
MIAEYRMVISNIPLNMDLDAAISKGLQLMESGLSSREAG